MEMQENRASLPMLLLSGQPSKEVLHEDSKDREQRFSTFPSATVAFGHESDFHGPLFSTLAALGSPRDTRAGRWTLEYVLCLSLLMALAPARALKDRFRHARRVLVALYPGRKRPGRTYQGYLKARRKLNGRQRQALQRHLRDQHRHLAGAYWQRDGWLAFSADGTRIEVPRTARNQKRFGCAGRKKTGPQLSLTSLYHLGTGLPWAWRIGAGTQSEQTQLQSLARWLPRGSLLVADAGFTSFALLRALVARGVQVLVRMGSNRTLLTGLAEVRVKVQGEVVWLWPMRKQSTCPPLPLRLIRMEPAKHSPVYLVTSVMDEQALTDRQVGQFYRRRWGHEVFYRSFKQTLEQHKMCSRSPSEARRELEWALLAYLVVGLWSVAALIGAQRDPQCWSVGESLRVVRQAMPENRGPRRRAPLAVLLRRAVKDSYVRTGSKEARHWPHKKNDPPAGLPKIRAATEKERRWAKRTCEQAEAA
jgi:Transposase DDE domain